MNALTDEPARRGLLTRRRKWMLALGIAVATAEREE